MHLLAAMMLLQLGEMDKDGPTVLAVMGLLAQVNEAMQLQQPPAQKRLTTLFALEGELTCMTVQVKGQLGCTGERQPTLLAGVGAASIMHNPVLLQVRGLSEGLIADITFVRPLTCMDQVVSHQIGQRGKSLATLCTLEGPLPCVNAHVVFYMHQLFELFPTELALVCPLKNMYNPFMTYHADVGGKLLLTLWALKTLPRLRLLEMFLGYTVHMHIGKRGLLQENRCPLHLSGRFKDFTSCAISLSSGHVSMISERWFWHGLYC